MNVLFVSLGCDKNLVDSEHMLGDLMDNGFSICDSEEDADIIVVNTCSFIADAMEESIQTIIDLGAYKENGRLKGLIVTGCLGQRFTEDILKDLPEVDAIIGTNSYDELVNAINIILEKHDEVPVFKKDLVGLPRDGRRVLTTGGHYAYLKIAEGCNKRCTYCAIPYIRGNYITDELIQCMATEPKICHYIDMPIQHCNDDILKSMGRKTNKADIMNIAARLRKAMPDISLRTTLICGFPGETEAMHEELLQCIKDMSFDRLGAFAYSREDGTVAAKMENQVEDSLKEKWLEEVMLCQKDISLSNNEKYIGRTLKVFIEGKLPEDGVFIGRTYRDTPSVDGFIFVNSETELVSGQFVDVTVTGFDEYDLIGDVKL